MKKQVLTLIAGVLIGAVAFGGVAIAADLVVVPSTQGVYVDGAKVTVDAYNINGSNYFKARDFAAAMDVGMWYKADANSVMIETDKGYDADYDGAAAPSIDTSKTPIGTVLMDEGGVKVTYNGVEMHGIGDTPMIYFLFSIENNSEHTIQVIASDASINDVMKYMMSGSGLEIQPGKKAAEKFAPTNLWETGIETINDIAKLVKFEFTLSVKNTEEYETLFTTDAITIYP